ncbi:hypothetical protein IFM89_018575, partial [Coptis chinensis]
GLRRVWEKKMAELAYVPEVILKKRKNNDEWAIKRRERLHEKKLEKQENKKLVFKRAEQFIEEYRTKELDFVNMKQRHRWGKSAFSTPESTLVFIIRIRRYPNLKSVKELVFKKGFLNINNQSVPLTDNNIIEQELGKHGVLCIEDIVHEIVTAGPHFKDITSVLLPFKLNRPEGGLQGKKKPFKDGGDAGNRQGHMNELINIMN